jgi:hypothetical protein
MGVPLAPIPDTSRILSNYAIAVSFLAFTAGVLSGDWDATNSTPHPPFFLNLNTNQPSMIEIIAVTLVVETIHFMVLMLPVAQKLLSFFLAVIVLYAFDAFLVSSLEAMFGKPDRRRLKELERGERR